MIGRKSPPLSETTNVEPKGFDDFALLLGDVMRGERATMGKSLLDVQRELKIKAAYISAIENTDPSAFETPGFIAGYVRSYARYLELDPEWAFTTFCQESGFQTAHGMSASASVTRIDSVPEKATGPRDFLEQPATPFTPKGEGVLARIEPGAVGSSLVLLALIGAIGYGGWSVLQEVQRVQFAPVEQTPTVVATLDPLAEQAAPVIADQAPDVIATNEALDRLYRPQALDVPVMTARDAPIATLDPRTIGSFAEEAPDVPNVATAGLLPEEFAPPVQVVEGPVPEVALLAVNPVWVRVRAADDSVIFEKILDAGEEYVLPATELPPSLRAGNSGSLYFKVNGDVYGPAGEGTSTIRDVALDREALKESYTVADIAANPDLAKLVDVAEVAAPITE
ncbi:helix-turn-helix domain-containing protein [Cognatishimia sp. MH4019]|uniref:helix-turn-helix domain-containing protein n=1 Tax=Cognatishimia sp. MH4019 TaxID=2854030 RepID=UPI001CD757F0|nr:helix-turn-helix domain-containing protein [Cognatishimia sp. MH4019]